MVASYLGELKGSGLASLVTLLQAGREGETSYSEAEGLRAAVLQIILQCLLASKDMVVAVADYKDGAILTLLLDMLTPSGGKKMSPDPLSFLFIVNGVKIKARGCFEI